MIVDVRALITGIRDALREDPALAADLRAAFGATSPDAWIPLAEAVVVAGTRGKNPVRTLRASLRRDGVAAAKVGGQLVIKREELSRWLDSKRIVTAPARPASECDDARAEARASVAVAARRFARDDQRGRNAS